MKTSCFDPNALAQIAALATEEQFRAFLYTFLTQGDTLIEAIQQATNAKNNPTLAQNLHALKGACKMIAAHEVVTCCEKLENELKISPPSRHNFSTLKTAYQRLTSELKFSYQL
jgi:HPt (histidine-containing phosphotransfer) domain-containing protein